MYQILIVSATGQQGRATIDALYRSSPSTHQCTIIALTRSASSSKAQSLQTTYPNLLLTSGDTSNPLPIFASHPQITSIFLLTPPPDDEAQALPIIITAPAPPSNVTQVIFSSVDRGGTASSCRTPTSVPHFAAKYAIELYLRQKLRSGTHCVVDTEADGCSWTRTTPACSGR